MSFSFIMEVIKQGFGFILSAIFVTVQYDKSYYAAEDHTFPWVVDRF